MTIVKGWQAASAASGIATRSLRRLVGTGALSAEKGPDGVYVFKVADLVQLKTTSGTRRTTARSDANPTVASSIGTTAMAPIETAATSTALPIAPWLLQAAEEREVHARGTSPSGNDDEQVRDRASSELLPPWRSGPLGLSMWPRVTAEDPVPVIDAQTLRVSYARVAGSTVQAASPPSRAPAPVRADATAYWQQRHAHVAALASRNAYEATAVGYPPEVVHAVWYAAGQAAWALGDQTLQSDHAYWYARRAGEHVVAAWHTHIAAMRAHADRDNDISRARVRRSRDRMR